MANNKHYQELVNSPTSHNLDLYTLGVLALGVAQGEDVDEIAMPMLVELRSGTKAEFPEGIEVLFILDTIVGLCANPSQLLELLQNPNIVRYEASRPGGSL